MKFSPFAKNKNQNGNCSFLADNISCLKCDNGKEYLKILYHIPCNEVVKPNGQTEPFYGMSKNYATIDANLSK